MPFADRDRLGTGEDHLDLSRLHDDATKLCIRQLRKVRRFLERAAVEFELGATGPVGETLVEKLSESFKVVDGDMNPAELPPVPAEGLLLVQKPASLDRHR